MKQVKHIQQAMKVHKKSDLQIVQIFNLTIYSLNVAFFVTNLIFQQLFRRLDKKIRATPLQVVALLVLSKDN